MAIASTGVGDGLMDIASGLMGLALISMVIYNAKNVNTLITTGGQTFQDLLSSVIAPGGGTGYRR